MSDSANHWKQDCVSIPITFHSFQSLYSIIFRSWTWNKFELQRTVYDFPFCHYIQDTPSRCVWRPSPDRLQMFAKDPLLRCLSQLPDVIPFPRRMIQDARLFILAIRRPRTAWGRPRRVDAVLTFSGREGEPRMSHWCSVLAVVVPLLVLRFQKFLSVPSCESPGFDVTPSVQPRRGRLNSAWTWTQSPISEELELPRTRT